MISDARKEEFAKLFEKFVEDFLVRSEGQTHLRRYEEGRRSGCENFTAIEFAETEGKDTTDMCLRLLLPYTDSTAHRASGVWVHVAPAIQGDIKEWFQRAGWTRPEDWPKVAKAILAFISRCVGDPSALQPACQEFNDLPYTTGLQTGLMTPILNALRPDEFMIVNNKSRRVINFFTAQSFKQRLSDYPPTNAVGLALVSEMSTKMRQGATQGTRLTDVFDMFCHWLVAVEKHAPIVGHASERRIKTAGRDVVVTVPHDEEEGGAASDQVEANTELREFVPNSGGDRQDWLGYGFQCVGASERQTQGFKSRSIRCTARFSGTPSAELR